MNVITLKEGDIVLNAKEIELVGLLADGFRIKEIANKAGMNVRTTESWLAEIRAKMEANSLSHLVAILFRKGVLE